MKAIYKTLTGLVFMAVALNAGAQDVRFSQLLNHPMQLNPALISSSNDFRVTLGHRAQWQSIEEGFQTESFSMIYPVFLKKDSWKSDRGNARLDIGLSVINDRVGAFNTVNPALSVSSGIKISPAQFVSLAIYGGYIYRMLNVDGLTFDEQYMYGSYSPGNPNGELIINETAGAPDVGFGLSWFYVPMDEDAKLNAYAGISGFHLNEYNNTFLDLSGKIQNKFSIQAGVKVLTEEWADIGAHAGYITQGGFQQFYIGLLTGMFTGETEKIIFGGWFKQHEAIALQLGFHHRSFIFDISYDFPYTDVSKSINNLTTWEVALGYRLNRVKRKNYVNSAFF